MAETVLLRVELDDGNVQNRLAEIEERLQGLSVQRNRLRQSLRGLSAERDETAAVLNDLTALTGDLGRENISTAEAISLLELALTRDRGESQLAQQVTAALASELSGLKDGSLEASEAFNNINSTTIDVNARFSQLDGEIRKVSSDFAAANLTFKEASREKRILQREARAVQGSLLEQRTELIRLKNEFQNLTPGINTTVDEYEALRQKIRQLNDSILEQERSIGVNQRNVGNYASAFTGALDRIVPGLNLTNLAMTAGSALFLELIGRAIDFGRAVARAVNELGKLRTEIATITGAEGDSLDRLTARTQAIAETFNRDFERIANDATALANRFGISYEEAFELVGTGLEGLSSEGGQEFLDIVREYPEFFRLAGLEASEFVAIANQQIQQGFFSDKGVDAIKEGTISLREFTDTTQDALQGIGIDTNDLQERIQRGQTTLFEAIQEISERLQQFPEQSQEVGVVLADVFRGAGEDAGNFVLNLANVTTSIEAVKESQNETTQQTRELRQANEELQLAYNRLLGPATGVFTEIQIALTEFLALILNRGLRVVEQLSNTFVDAYNNIGFFRVNIQGTIVLIRTLFDIIQGVGSGIGALFESLALGGRGLINILSGNVSEGTALIGEALTRMRENVEFTIQDITENFLEGFKFEPLDPVTIFDDNAPETMASQGSVFAGRFADGFKNKIEEEKQEIQNAIIEALNVEAQNIEIDLLTNTDLTQAEEFSQRRRLIEIEREIALENEELTTSEKLAIQRRYIEQLQTLNQEFNEQTLIDRRAVIEAELASETQGTRRYFDLLERDLTLERDLKLQNDELTAKERLAIEAQYLADVADLRGQQAQEFFEINEQLQLGNLEREYEQALISESEFIRRRNEIEREFARIELENFQGTLLEKTRLEQEQQIQRLQNEREFQRQIIEERIKQVESEAEIAELRNGIAENFGEAILSIAQDERDAYRETADGQRESLEEESAILKAGLAIKKATAINEIRINLQRQLALIDLKASQEALIPGLGIALSASTLLRKGFAIVEAAARTAAVLSTRLEDGGQVAQQIHKQTGISPHQILFNGGLLFGPSHSNGGIPAIVAGVHPIEMEGGEFVNNVLSTNTNGDILQTINEDRGRTKFSLVKAETGGALQTLIPSLGGGEPSKTFASGGLVFRPNLIPRYQNGGNIVTAAQVAAGAGFNPFNEALNIAQLGEVLKNLPAPVASFQQIDKGIKQYNQSIQFDD